MATQLALPYAHLNLRRNPFGELDRDERAQIAVAEVDYLVRRLRSPGVVVQLLGASGCGKTTHLLAIRSRFPDAPFVKVIEEFRTKVPRGSPVFVDDAHLLPGRQLRALLRRAASFVLTTHRDLEEDVLAAGLESVVVRPAERLNAERLQVIFDRRIEAARRGPGPVPRLPRATVGRLVARFRDDVRSMEQELYEAFARLRGCTDVQL